ncbi:MAG: transposase [Candidatus Anammoxibacter sp.]
MTRPLRVEYPGAFYHVFSRGNAGEKVFKGERDKEKFLEYMGKFTERFSVVMHTYCIMSNHYHLLIETQEANLSAAIQWLNISYAIFYNKKHQRSGHIFQGRFKSILVDKDEYIKQLSRYIHLNPVRAKIVQKPLDYTWSSYSSFIGKTKENEWLETEGLLGHFGRKLKESRNNYKRYVEEVDAGSIKNPNKEVSYGFLLGDDSFVKWVYKQFISPRGENKEIPELKKIRPKVSVDKVVKMVCKEFECKNGYILQKGRKRNVAREITIYLTRDICGETGKKLGEYFGGVSGAAITYSYNSIFNKSCKDRKLRKRIDKVKNQILNP